WTDESCTSRSRSTMRSEPRASTGRSSAGASTPCPGWATARCRPDRSTTRGCRASRGTSAVACSPARAQCADRSSPWRSTTSMPPWPPCASAAGASSVRRWLSATWGSPPTSRTARATSWVFGRPPG
ncbi:MAG: hypothetical protein AVDCRST_MAG20-2859, partial [uncultured Acidimicrobiales bacterium]